MIDLWLPPKPAIIRASDMPTAQELRKELLKGNLVPSFCPGDKLKTLTLVGYATATGSTGSTPKVTLPVGSKEGDLCLVQFFTTNTSPGIPPGMTGLVTTTYSSNRTVSLAYTLLTASNIATGTISGWGGGAGSNSVSIVVLRPNTAIRNITGLGPQGQATSGNPALQTITVSGATAPLLLLGGGYAAITGSNPGISLTGTLVSAGTVFVFRPKILLLAYEFQPSAPLNRTVDCGAGGGTVTMLQSCYLKLS